MELLLVPVVLIGLLVLGTHVLGGTIALREHRGLWRRVREQYRAMPRRQRAVSVGFVSVSVLAGLALVWAIESPAARSTVGWVLLVIFGGLAAILVALTPVLIWREHRAAGRRRSRG